MDLGFALPTSGAWATPSNNAEIAQACDRHGYRTLWTFQRLLFPVSDDISPVYRSVLDPLIALGFAAATTTRIRLGLAVVNGLFYAPAVLAKQLVTLDVLSGGRLDAGIGLGWSADEYEATGVSRAGRGRRFEEWLYCLDALMSQDPVAFDGEFYSVPPSRVGPMPVQKPRPPVFLGGGAEPALRRAGARADGWISSSRASLEEIRAGVILVRDASEEAGKERGDVRCIVRGVTIVTDEPVAAQGRRPLHGSVDQIRGDLAVFDEAGVDEVFLDLNFDFENVGNPEADPDAAMEKAVSVIEGCSLN
ncbi:MAG: luciferase-like protein [Pseudonocardiales bacterium]|nr:luciferase-like protein [Pseudonocardiales bacterium]